LAGRKASAPESRCRFPAWQPRRRPAAKRDQYSRFHLSLLPLIVPPRRCRRRGAEEASLMVRLLALACAFALSAATALAQEVESTVLPPYGPAITLEQAKRVMAAAELEAAENTWQVAITILDSGGNLVMFHKVDNAQLSAIGVSEGKARTALQFKRPSKDLDDAIARGSAGGRLLALKDITPIEGGVPITLDGKIIGAIGVSGAISAQDTQVAKAGIAALTK
jgi:glc operon protein GlcG